MCLKRGINRAPEEFADKHDGHPERTLTVEERNERTNLELVNEGAVCVDCGYVTPTRRSGDVC